MKLDLIFKEFPAFRKWTVAKKLNSSHLSILTEFEDLEKIKPLICWIETHGASHSQGIQILELAGELLLKNQNIAPFLSACQEPESIIRELKKLRFPESSSREEKKREILNKLRLGGSIQAKWIREKDRTGLKLEFKSFSQKDLKQKIEKLNSLYWTKQLWEN